MAPNDHADIRGSGAGAGCGRAGRANLVSGLTPEQGVWRREPGSWSVSECLDHLATANRVYLRAMEPAAAHALQRGRRRRRAALPGLIGGWFVRTLEPPVKPRFKMKAPKKIVPRASPALSDAAAQFLASQDDVRAFLKTYADIDLAGVRFANPFIRGVRFSLATGLHVIAAHERRHLWQAWNVRARAVGERRVISALGDGQVHPLPSVRGSAACAPDSRRRSGPPTADRNPVWRSPTARLEPVERRVGVAKARPRFPRSETPGNSPSSRRPRSSSRMRTASSRWPLDGEGVPEVAQRERHRPDELVRFSQVLDRHAASRRLRDRRDRGSGCRARSSAPFQACAAARGSPMPAGR